MSIFLGGGAQACAGTAVQLCVKMHCYFLLNIKHGASQLYLGV